MGQCVAEEGHAAQDHVAAYQRADDPHDHRRGHAAHHEGVGERFEEKIKQVGHGREVTSNQ